MEPVWLPGGEPVTLSIEQLGQAGLFNENQTGRRLVIRWRDANDNLPRETCVDYDRNAGVVKFIYPDGEHIWYDVAYHPAEQPSRSGFYCPLEGHLVPTLALRDLIFRTPAMLNTPEYTLWNNTAAWLSRPAQGLFLRLVLAGDRLLEARQVRARHRRRIRQNGLDIASALQASAARYARKDLARIRARMLEREREPALEFPVGLAEPAAWEDHPRLDLRVLGRRGLLKLERRTAFVALWPRALEVRGVVDLTDEAQPSLQLLFALGRRKWRQDLSLTAVGSAERARWTLVCPHSGQPADVLAFRHGHFASREAQRLINASQRSAKWRREAIAAGLANWWEYRPPKEP